MNPLQHSELESLSNDIINPGFGNVSCSNSANFVSYIDKVAQTEMAHHKWRYVTEEEKNYYLIIENLTNCGKRYEFWRCVAV